MVSFAYTVCFPLIYGILYSVATASHPDEHLDTPQLIVRYGYPTESHKVTTEDGYILTLHRIPHSPKSPAAPHKPVVFLQHGLISSSADWIILGPEKSLGYLLADEGYDVWLGNSRGNTYSKNHTTLSNKSRKYWDFSWHEMGVYDLPAMMDYVLEETQQKTLNFVGTSMGCTMFYVLTSMRTEYNAKVRLMVSLAPSAYMGNVTTPLAKLESITKVGLQFLNSLGVHEFFPSGSLMEFIADKVCRGQSSRTLCSNILFFLCGYDSQQLDESLLPVLISHTPAGASIKSLMHYLQEMGSGKFEQFDYGKLNLLKYKQRTPPEYDLSSVTVPVALMFGKNDPFADPLDVMKLSRVLPNVLEIYQIPWDSFNHLDFVWAKDVKPLVNDKVIEFLRNDRLNNV